jgi:site-specific DNA-methyltransferase (adenine-specific)
MPEEEMRCVVEALTKPGQVVLDPFCGLGSTLIACQQLGRHYVGCDLGLTYCRIAKRRLRLDRERSSAGGLGLSG